MFETTNQDQVEYKFTNIGSNIGCRQLSYIMVVTSRRVSPRRRGKHGHFLSPLGAVSVPRPPATTHRRRTSPGGWVCKNLAKLEQTVDFCFFPLIFFGDFPDSSALVLGLMIVWSTCSMHQPCFGVPSRQAPVTSTDWMRPSKSYIFFSKTTKQLILLAYTRSHTVCR